MKTVISVFRRAAIASGVLALIVVTLAACKKDNVDNPDIPAAGLMAFNLAADQPAIGVSLSGNALTTQPLSFTNYTGYYQGVYTGDRPVETFDVYSDSLLAKSNFSFEDNKYYSLFVVGNKGGYRNVIVNDAIDSLDATKAHFRYINAIADSSAPAVTVTSGGTNVIDQPSPFSTVSDFTAVNGGELAVQVNNGSNISASRNISLENGKVYTVLLVGVPGATDSAKAVQIRYVENGTITPSAAPGN